MHQLDIAIHRCAKNEVSSLNPLARMAVHTQHRRRCRRWTTTPTTTCMIAIGSFGVSQMSQKANIGNQLGRRDMIKKITKIAAKFKLFIILSKYLICIN